VKEVEHFATASGGTKLVKPLLLPKESDVKIGERRTQIRRCWKWQSHIALFSKLSFLRLKVAVGRYPLFLRQELAFNDLFNEPLGNRRSHDFATLVPGNWRNLRFGNFEANYVSLIAKTLAHTTRRTGSQIRSGTI
jgi:hypothetical protein